MPDSSLSGEIHGHEPRVGGYVVYPNLLVAAPFLVVFLAPLLVLRARRAEPGELR